jgi:hypothetical protein
MAKIKEIKAENYRSLRLMRLSPTGTVVRILGTNGQGKSNALAGIRAVLLGERDGAGDVVTHGEGRATFTVTLDGGLSATMRWGGVKDRTLELLKIDGEDVSTVQRPRDLLDRIAGPFHDVGKILRIDTPEGERKLRDALLQAAGVSVDDLDKEIEQATAARALANAEGKKLKARLDAMPRPRADLPESEVSAAALLRLEGEIREALDTRAHAERERHELERRQEAARAAVADLERRLTDARRALTEAETALNEHEIPDAPAPTELSAVREKLAGLDETNAAIRAAREWAELVASAADTEAAAKAAQARIDAAGEAKTARLAAAPLPIPGAEITEDGLTYNGERFHNLSRGQRLVVAVGLGIATRGKLDVLILDDAEGLDAENEATIERMAVEAGVQVFMASAVKSGAGIFVSGAEYEIETAGAEVAA